jgi:hypothetical protein
MIDLNYIERVTRAGRIVKNVVSLSSNNWLVLSQSRSAKSAGVKGWTVEAIAENEFKCTCPDFTGKSRIGETSVRTWNKRFNPCKHIIAVCMKEPGFSFMQIIIKDIQSINRRGIVAFLTKITTAEETLIAINTGVQIQLFSITVELAGITANTVTIRNGTAGTVLNKYVLINQGDVKGYIGNHAEITANANITVECSSTSAVNIYTRSMVN